MNTVPRELLATALIASAWLVDAADRVTSTTAAPSRSALRNSRGSGLEPS
jgi:hypothetical protein